MTPRHFIDGEILEGAARPLDAFLTENPGPVVVVINSPGGIASEGAAMVAVLERHGAVTALIEGVAASAASLAAMGAHTIRMHRDAFLMIHDPAMFTFGAADEHRQTAEVLEAMARIYAASYARATGHPVERVRAWMKAETWMTAEEALSLNFCDEITGGEDPARAVASFDYRLFRNPPARLLAQGNGTATDSPKSSTNEVSNA